MYGRTWRPFVSLLFLHPRARGCRNLPPSSGVTDPDIHNLAITVGPPKTLLTVTPREIFSSTDNGATWEPVQVRSQLSIPYCRGVLVKADDPQVIYLGNGESAFGGLGALHRSRDRGRPGRPCRYH